MYMNIHFKIIYIGKIIYPFGKFKGPFLWLGLQKVSLISFFLLAREPSGRSFPSYFTSSTKKTQWSIFCSPKFLIKSLIFQEVIYLPPMNQSKPHILRRISLALTSHIKSISDLLDQIKWESSNMTLPCDFICTIHLTNCSLIKKKMDSWGWKWGVYTIYQVELIACWGHTQQTLKLTPESPPVVHRETRLMLGIKLELSTCKVRNSPLILSLLSIYQIYFLWSSVKVFLNFVKKKTSFKNVL